MNTVRRFATGMALATALAMPALAQAQMYSSAGPGSVVDTTPSAGTMAVDLVVVRPASLVATVVGTGLFILQLPLDLIGWQSPGPPARKLVIEPAQFTFTRELGRFD